MSGLSARDCVPCEGGVPPMTATEIEKLLPEIGGWEASGGHHLVKTYAFKNFAEALAFVDRVGAMAEEQWHHPDVHLAWGKVTVELWTHKIDGLTESDFVFAAKCDALRDGG
ncbi:MAG TPA: 4a-hydroxytetrahydrobiopterin dehydratase [Candidatus Eremiobacteraceae bacterium]